VRFAATHADKGSVFVIAGGLTGTNFFFGLLVGHSSIDAIEDLAFRQTSIFEPRNFGAGHYLLAIQMALKNELNRGVRETDQLESDGVDADGIEQVYVGDIEDLRLGESGASQIGCGLAADKEMLVNVRSADQLNASVIAEPCVLRLDNLGDFLVRNIKPFELLNIAGEHTRLVEGTVVREGMLMAAHRRESAHTEKQSLVPHIYIVWAGKRETRECAWVIPG
jgi:hypothetical protein